MPSVLVDPALSWTSRLVTLPCKHAGVKDQPYVGCTSGTAETGSSVPCKVFGSRIDGTDRREPSACAFRDLWIAGCCVDAAHSLQTPRGLARFADSCAALLIEGDIVVCNPAES